MSDKHPGSIRREVAYPLADLLKEGLDIGCARSRREVKFALANLSRPERALLSKLLARSSKRWDRHDHE